MHLAAGWLLETVEATHVGTDENTGQSDGFTNRNHGMDCHEFGKPTLHEDEHTNRAPSLNKVALSFTCSSTSVRFFLRPRTQLSYLESVHAMKAGQKPPASHSVVCSKSLTTHTADDINPAVPQQTKKKHTNQSYGFRVFKVMP